MKQMEVTEERIGEYTFYIKPFPAFAAANLSGELDALITPMLAGIASAAGETGGADDIMNLNAEEAIPAVSGAFSDISGEKLEKLIKKLLIDHRNISVEGEATDNSAKLLTYDLANEIFCGEVQDMYILCFYVIRLNFSGFFRKLGTRFGSLQGAMQNLTPST